MKTLINILTTVIISQNLLANNFEDQYELAISLRGQWKFMIGDNMNWSSATYNDSDWETVGVPSSWEDEGFPGYDGYAWYRKQFTISGDYKNASLMIVLGHIDDVDEVYINGVKVGNKGSFPPNYSTAYNATRRYIIPMEILKFDQPNTVAVRVYDSQLQGGIVSGSVGIFSRQYSLPIDINLEGYWKFKTGDDMNWAQAKYDDSNWKKLYVPSYWEEQISSSYDGFAWYRRSFKADATAKDQRYVLMLGKIDDLDEVYLNGKLVGKTGKIYDEKYRISHSNEYSMERYYYLNSEDIISGQLNTIAVRVYDGAGEGGIYSGPVGLVELNRFVTFWRKKTKHK